MKKTLSLTMALLVLASAAFTAAPSLEGLSVTELEAVRAEADSRLRQMQLPDQDGYLTLQAMESYLRAPQQHLGEKVRLDGEILHIQQRTDGSRYIISPDTSPTHAFAVDFSLAADQPLLLPGDLVTAFGVYQGLAPQGPDDPDLPVLPLMRAELVTRRVPPQQPLAAAPHAGTREDPAPPGIRANYQGTYWTDYAAFEMEILSVRRGNEALKSAQNLSKYNITPPRTQEYFLVEMRVKALAAPNGRADIAEEDFYFVSAAGTEYRHHFLINSTQTLRNLYPDGEQVALLACLIDKGDMPLLVFQPLSTAPLWFDPNASP